MPLKLNGSTSGYIIVDAPAVAGTTTLTLPTTSGTIVATATGQLSPASVSDQLNSSTGYFDLPTGTTAQRPASPVAGMIRFNTDTGSVESYNGTIWSTIGAQYPSATGGTITTLGDYRYHFFSGSDNFVLTNSGNTLGSNVFDVLVVAGGGASSIQHSGGAGAGGLIIKTGFQLSGGTYAVAVGAGATVTSNSNSDDNYRAAGANGSNSTVFGLTALGGGGARPWASNDANVGSSGGSGGAGWNANGGAGLQPSQAGDSGTYGFGNRAGNGSGASGGGAGAVGNDGGGSTGGAGKYISQFAQFGVSGYFAGGGGGGNSSGGAGGIGGGGGGVPTGQGYPPVYGNGTANTGGGGGGGGDNTTCGSGGSGVVIIRYKFQN